MGSVPRVPRPGGRIVEVANFPSRFQADAALALLETNGIEAMAKYGDAEGWAPFFAMIDGFRVLVFDEDLDAAQALLESSDVFEPPRSS
jgi:Putative prokaryotic signal transducing protein